MDEEENYFLSKFKFASGQLFQFERQTRLCQVLEIKVIYDSRKCLELNSQLYNDNSLVTTQNSN